MVSGEELDGNGHENQKNGEENVYTRVHSDFFDL
jgi:hypothetical protein